MFFSGLDFNSKSAICAPAKSFFVGRADARRQVDFRPVDRVLAADNVSSLCRPLWWGAQDQALHVPRAVSVSGVCAADLSGKSSRYRSLPAGASREAVSHGDSQPRLAQHFGGCERGSGLAYLRRLCPTLDRHGSQALRRRFLWRGSEGNGLRARHHDDRLVPVRLSVGAVSQCQSRGQTAHAARSARQYPGFYSYQRRENARGQHTRAGAWGFLHRGSRLLGFQAAVSLSRSGQLLCHARQGESASAASLLPSGGSRHRIDLRSDDLAHGILLAQRLPDAAAAHPFQRSEDRQAADLLDQQLCAARFDDRRSVSMPLAGGAVFQMDQAASSYQTVLWHFRERGEDTDLDRRVGVGVGGHREKALEYLGEPLRNATDLEPDHV